ncbi:intraflagellar transport protein 22 homolog [Sceloporus undulatus]|uniref:intraflagellar transport protein 22 homolog n=1 Tax=Sceloporus undulatus TaxID=8520 RepID=UPI001C4D5AA0|nr:intraflagellar transport protein 22 homolog [Sceloporus undulatus]XP_042298765.1 intraflagellar transport protein 22 homolog [Sceloporus undulatus]
MLKVKILFVGPSEAGKSVLANFLSESTEGIGSYIPTQGVRILEYEKPQMNENSKGSECRFELWDCGGDQKFETCWPALMKDSHGVVIIFNPDVPSHVKEIEMWHSCFIQQPQLLDSQCLLIAHHKPGSSGDTGNLNLPSPLDKLQLIHSSLEEDPEDVRMEFVKYLKNITNLVNENRDREEMSLIT